MKMLSSILALLAASQCVMGSPVLSYTAIGSIIKGTPTVTDIPNEAVLTPNAVTPPSAAAVGVKLNTNKMQAGEVTCTFKLAGTGDAGGRVGLRMNLGATSTSAKFHVKINSRVVVNYETISGGGTHIEQVAIGDTITVLITNTASATTAKTAYVCLQVAAAPGVTVIGSLSPVYSSHSILDGSTYTDTDPFREGYQIIQEKPLTLNFAVNSITLHRNDMFPAYSYNGTGYLAVPSIYTDGIGFERIAKLVSEDTTRDFYHSNIDTWAEIPAGGSSVVKDLGSLPAVEVPTIPSGTWFKPQYQIKLYQNCGIDTPVYQLIDDETSPLPSTPIQMLSKPTVTATGLEMTAFRRAYPTEVPITIKFGSVPAAGKQVIVQDETNTTLCSRILDANGQTTVPVVVPSNFVNATFERRIRWISDEPLWNSVDLIKGGLSVRNNYSNSLAGRLTLEGGCSNPADIACMIRLQKMAGVAVESTQYRYPVILDNGNYQLQDIDPGTYRVLIAPIKYQLDSPDKLRWLSLLLGEMTLANSSQSLGNNASLHSGDIAGEYGEIGTRDDEVNLADLTALIARYGTTVRSSAWNDEADMDADGEVTLYDVMVIDRNFMARGDD